MVITDDAVGRHKLSLVTGTRCW